MNAHAATKATVTFGWLLAMAAFIAVGSAAPEASGPGPAPASSAPAPPKEHPKIGKTDCAECHSDLTSKANVHGAAADCSACHDYTETASGVSGKVVLKAQGAALCVTCHEDTKTALSQRKMAHTPAQDDCATCHDPHSSDVAKLLKAKQMELCGTCHSETTEKIAGHKRVHAPVNDPGCSACHEPHAANHAQLLKAEPEALCMSCHKLTDDPKNKTVKRILETPDGRGHPLAGHPYTGVKDPSHKDGRMLSCQSCHHEHSGNRKNFLKDPREKGDFCTRCH